MSNEWLKNAGFETLAIREGFTAGPEQEYSDPIYVVSQQAAFGGVLSFDVDGRRDRAWALINAVQLMSLPANLGDVKTTV